VNNQNQR